MPQSPPDADRRSGPARAVAVSVLLCCVGAAGFLVGSRTSSATPVADVAAAAPATRTVPEAAIATQQRGDARPDPDFGYVRELRRDRGAGYLVFDRATLLTGAAADRAAAAHGDATPVPGDYYIVDDDPQLLVLPLARGVRVIGADHLAGSSTPVPASLAALRHWTAAHPAAPGLPVELRYDGAGAVIRIAEVSFPS